MFVPSTPARALRWNTACKEMTATYRWVLDNGVPRFSPDGAFLGYIGSCIDITALKETEQALHETQKRYRMATEAGHVGVWDLNLETGEIYVDPQLKELLGFTGRRHSQPSGRLDGAIAS